MRNIRSDIEILKQKYFMKVFHGWWNAPETVFREMLWKKNFTVSLKVSFNLSFPEIKCIKIQTIDDSLCFIYFEVIIRQQLKKKFKLVDSWTFFPAALMK